MPKRLPLVAAFVAAIAVRIYEVLRPDALGRLVDDAFMYFDTARTLGVAGHLSTSGIQPLYTLLCAIPYAILRPETLGELDRAARICVGIGVLGDLAAIALLTYLLWRASGPLAATIGAWIWALHPGVVAFSINGLETSWALAGLLAVVLAFEYGRRDWLTGVAVAFAMLCRVDLAGVGVAVALCVLWDVRRESHPWPILLKRGAQVLAGWSVLYLPWLAFLHAQTGDVLPVSGPATLLLSYSKQVGFNDAPHTMPYWLWVLGVSTLALSFGAPLFALACTVLSRYANLLRFRVLAIQCALAFTFYAFFHQGWWYVGRYLAPVLVLEIVVVSLGLATLGHLRIAVPVLAAVLYFIAAPSTVLSLPMLPASGMLVATHDYRQAALDVGRVVPEGETIAAVESGAASYYLTRHTVLNADGVTDRRTYNAIRRQRLGEDLYTRGARYTMSRGSDGGWIANCSGAVKMTLVADAGEFNVFTLEVPERASR